MTAMIKTRIHWDIGTAYDLFISLRILHDPERYGFVLHGQPCTFPFRLKP